VFGVMKVVSNIM